MGKRFFPLFFTLKPIQAKADYPEHDNGRTMIREHDPVLHIDPSYLGLISSRWTQVYLAVIQRHEKKYAESMQQIAQRRDRTITSLHSGRGYRERGGWW